MNKITFYASTFSPFQHLNLGVPLRLLEVFIKDTDDISKEFSEYENTYWDWKVNRSEALEMPKGSKVLVLLFEDDTKKSGYSSY